MNNDMKCPFCQQELIPCVQNQNDWLYHCDNQKCPIYDDADNENAKHLLASEDLWQELIRTRKALEIAVDALKRIKNHATAIDTAICRAEVALEQIQALEQKDVK